MACDVYWIKLQTSTFDSETIMLIESLPEGDTVLIIWLKMQILAGKCNAGGYLLLNSECPYTDEMLATVFRRPLNTVRLAISAFLKFKMVEIINGAYFLLEWEKYQNISGLDKIKEQTRQRVARHRAKAKGVTLPVTQGNATDTDTEIDLDLEKQQQIRLLLQNTPLSKITDRELRSLIKRHGELHLLSAADIAVETWRRENKVIQNPGGYLQSLCTSLVTPSWYLSPKERKAKDKAAEDQKRTEQKLLEKQKEIEEREAQERDDYWRSLPDNDRQMHRIEIKKSSPLFDELRDEALDGIAKLHAWDNRPQMSTNAISSA